MESLKSKALLLARAGLATWAALIALASLLARPPVAETVASVEGGDLAVHAAVYAVLALLGLLSLPGPGWTRRVLLAGCAAFGFGLVLECLQPLTGRYFEGADLLANLLGVLTALVGAHVLRRLREQRRADR